MKIYLFQKLIEQQMVHALCASNTHEHKHNTIYEDKDFEPHVIENENWIPFKIIFNFNF